MSLLISRHDNTGTKNVAIGGAWTCDLSWVPPTCRVIDCEPCSNIIIAGLNHTTLPLWSKESFALLDVIDCHVKDYREAGLSIIKSKCILALCPQIHNLIFNQSWKEAHMSRILCLEHCSQSMSKANFCNFGDNFKCLWRTQNLFHDSPNHYQHLVCCLLVDGWSSVHKLLRCTEFFYTKRVSLVHQVIAKNGLFLDPVSFFTSLLQLDHRKWLLNKSCPWLDSKPGPLVLEATTLSTVPQPPPAPWTKSLLLILKN